MELRALENKATMVRVAFDTLRATSFLVYLASWLALGLTAIAGALPRRNRLARASSAPTVQSIAGMLLQALSALPISLSLPEGSLRPHTAELIGGLTLAPLAAIVFTWSLWSVRKNGDGLVTTGAYARLRHPVYFAFLAMLLATGLLVSARATLIVAVATYIVGAEMRVREEESDLERRFGQEHAEYRRTTRWAYVPGLR